MLPSPTVIKLDVEGHELSVLEGLSKRLLLPSLHTVVFEDSVQQDTAVKTLLQKAGFTCKLLSRSEKSAHDLQKFVAHRASPAVANVQ